MTRARGMALDGVLTLIETVRGIGCRFLLQGGWGVDARLGRHTRSHRDLDLDVDAAFEDEVLTTLHDVGNTMETDWRLNRVELVAPGRGWVDLHPLLIDEDGSVRQADLGGGWHEFPRSYFTIGSLGDTSVPCVSSEAQRAFRTGYELRGVDRHDLAVLDHGTADVRHSAATGRSA